MAFGNNMSSVEPRGLRRTFFYFFVHIYDSAVSRKYE